MTLVYSSKRLNNLIHWSFSSSRQYNSDSYVNAPQQLDIIASVRSDAVVCVFALFAEAICLYDSKIKVNIAGLKYRNFI